MVVDNNSSLEYLVIIAVRESSILGPMLFLLYIKGHIDDAICNIAIYGDGTLLNSECDQVFRVVATAIVGF